MTPTFKSIALKRAIKIAANGLKPLFGLHLMVFPGKRYAFPDRQEPLSMRASTPGRIPRIVWQTNFSRHATLAVAANRWCNRRMAPDHEFRFMDDDACDDFVRTHYPGRIFEAYMSLNIGAARADVWRILVLLKHGGVYLDIDATLVAPISTVIRPDMPHLFLLPRNAFVTNFFLACAPGDPVMEALVAETIDRVEARRESSIMSLTGPMVVDLVVRRMGVECVPAGRICQQGQFTNKATQYRDKPGGDWGTEQDSRPLYRAPPQEAGTPGIKPTTAR
jgi:mannosyltransferase OCH1-like enzyme